MADESNTNGRTDESGDCSIKMNKTRNKKNNDTNEKFVIKWKN